MTRVAARHPAQVVQPDLFTLLCPSAKYQEGAGAVASVRADGEHYTAEGADYVAAFLRPYIVSADR